MLKKGPGDGRFREKKIGHGKMILFYFRKVGNLIPFYQSLTMRNG
jgi:hypothetical protein